MFGDFWPSDFLVGRLAKGDGTGGEGDGEGVTAIGGEEFSGFDLEIHL